MIRKFVHHVGQQSKRTRICALIIVCYLLLALAAPRILPYSVDDFSHPSLTAPSWEHLLGTDEIGHDIFSLLLNGFSSTVSITLRAGVLSTLLGTLLAFLSVYLGSLFDKILDTISTLLLIVPDMIIILFVASLTRPSSLMLILLIILFGWSRVYKNIRSKLKDLMSENRVLYLLSNKGNLFDIIQALWRDVWPVFSYYLLIQTNRALMYETTLSFFGIGDPLAKTWGKLIHAALNYPDLYYDRVYLWYLLPAVGVLVIFIVSISLLITEVQA